ncbi:helicase-like transcription factor CHR28 [Selaginella moellendorffii]|uniref:helicase-like transcription factor CHR28 n=1 Tax=Selaginella moellendorffii TaxID=88036 RepID=UPI000D1D0895|nr:helicase-like transcription factor CHR28 [Selaginella moellendorffii]XP_024520680.1 helicase-like transcription factor CHR28 [Selaginella moellendorffii]|eukprot:XP_024520679.1 helicase-like transcription factor CHR28 [Selaginella moellendorffii]
MTMCQRPVGDPCQKLLEESRICAGGIDQSYTNQEWNAFVDDACVQHGVQGAESVAAQAEPEADMELDQLFFLLKEPEKNLQDIVGQDEILAAPETSPLVQAPQEYTHGVSPSLHDPSSSATFPYYQSSDYDRSSGSVIGAEGEVYDPTLNSTTFTPVCESSWSFGNGAAAKSEVIEISDGEEDEVGIVGEKRKLPLSFASQETTSKAWWYAQEQTNASVKKEENGNAEVLNSDDESDQRDERGGTTRRHYSSEPRVQEDRNLRTILQRMITVDEKEEASPEEGLMTIPLLKHQRIALAWMEKSENRVECSGGILADDQGLGKTVSTIALILKARAPVSKLNLAISETALIESEPVDLDDDEDGDKDDDESSQKLDDRKSSLGRGRKTGGTLVICPTSVLRQWAHEIKAKVTPAANLSILVYHGSSRTRSADDLAKYDVVLTTYPIVSMEVPKQLLPEEKEEDKRNYDDYGLGNFRGYPKKKSKPKKRLSDEKIPESGPLAKVSWYRVVLDEAQSIKNSRTQVARACWGLRAKKRWCLSGTPIQNAIDDLYSYFRFLRFDPLDTYKSFRSEVKDPITRNPVLGYKKLQLILQVVMLRRTKATLIDGQPIVNLPPRFVCLQQAEFSEEERIFYNSLELESRRQFQVYAEEGTLQSNYVNILYMLLRLRQACDHPLLVKETNNESTEFDAVENVKKLALERRVELQNTLDRNKSICTICADVPEWAVISWCGHVFCRQCISEKLATSDDTECPFPKCTIQLNSCLLYSLTALRNCNLGIEPTTNNNNKGKKKRQPTDTNGWISSSKIEAVMKLLKNLPVKNPAGPAPDGTRRRAETEKAIVFSQWTSMLDLLEPQLRKADLRFSRLDGTMTVVERDSAVTEFNTNPEVSVMIMSLKAASLGLNMVAACHVLLLDVWWNPTTEDQAIDRAHRIGQTRPVHVSRFTVKNTIEDRILALQERKKQMVSSAFGENEGNNQKSRLTMDDIRFLFSG